MVSSLMTLLVLIQATEVNTQKLSLVEALEINLVQGPQRDNNKPIWIQI